MSLAEKVVILSLSLKNEEMTRLRHIGAALVLLVSIGSALSAAAP